MIQQEQSEIYRNKNYVRVPHLVGQILPEFCSNLARPRRNVRGPHRVPGGSRENPLRAPAVCIFAEGVLYRASQS